jgi:hypothetical protein
MHKWNKEDAIITLYYERFGTEGLQITPKELAECVICSSLGSLKMMSANHRYLLDSKGFEHVSNIQKEVVDEYSALNKDDLKKVVLSIIDKRDLSLNKNTFQKREKTLKNKKELDNIFKSLGKDPRKMKKLN